MARVNIGVNPLFLADQHLIAESVEITMITGGLKKNDYNIKSNIPESFKLGTGHINFFKTKLLYLHKRLQEVNSEMKRRNFNPSTTILDVLNEAPQELINDWYPDHPSSKIIRERIVSRLIQRTSGKTGQGFYRYSGKVIPDVCSFSYNLLKSKLYYV